MLVERILAAKGHEVATILPTATVAEALDELHRYNVGALVISGDGRLANGIVSERDIVRALAVAGRAVFVWPVADLMTIDLVTCGPTTPIDELMATMTERRIRHVPVLDEGGQLAGIVSIGDVVKTRVDELEQQARQLVDYIRTGR